jgi:hypothetical protein
VTWRLLPLALRVKRTGWPAIWLPLIVIWPLIIAIFCLALPLCWLWPARVSPAAGRRGFATLGASYRVLCAAHGAQFELGERGGNAWDFSIY